MKPQRMVYFLRQLNGLGPVKIGSSIDVQTRLTNYNRVAPYQLGVAAQAPGTTREEYFLHACFWLSRTHHEWFRPTPDVEAMIASVIATGTLAYAHEHLTAHPEYSRGRPAVWTEEMRADASETTKAAWLRRTAA